VAHATHIIGASPLASIATMNRSFQALLCAAIATVSGFLPAHAVQQPPQIEVTYLYPNLSTVYAGPVSVGLPAQLTGFAGILNIALSTNAFTLTLSTNAGVNDVDFDGVRFVDLQQSLNFGALALNTAATNYAGFDASRVIHAGPDTLYVNLQGLPGLNGQQIVLNAAPVPEPATWALMACGVAVLLGAARRRA
jgi:hypothetical protein